MDTPNRLWGWKDIGAMLGRNERWARRHGHPDRPGRIPAIAISGQYTITTADLLAWVDSNRAAMSGHERQSH